MGYPTGWVHCDAIEMGTEKISGLLACLLAWLLACYWLGYWCWLDYFCNILLTKLFPTAVSNRILLNCFFVVVYLVGKVQTTSFTGVHFMHSLVLLIRIFAAVKQNRKFVCFWLFLWWCWVTHPQIKWMWTSFVFYIFVWLCFYVVVSSVSVSWSFVVYTLGCLTRVLGRHS